MQMTAEAHEHKGNQDDHEYDVFLEKINQRVAGLIVGGRHLFLVDTGAVPLWDIYLSAFAGSPKALQYHTCSACRHFIERYGSAVVISDDGLIESALWDVSLAPEPYKAAVAMMAHHVLGGSVIGPLVTSEEVLGHAKTGIWSHLHLRLPKAYLFPKTKVLTAGQKAAELREDHKNMKRALAEFPTELLAKALTLLEQDALYRSEKVRGPVAWLHQLQSALDYLKVKGKRRDNIIWNAVASAPTGYTHPRSSMAGTLLEDLAAGMDFDTVSKRFAPKMHPLAYQRPQAAPTEGNIKRGEEIIAKLGLQRSLERRFARIDEVQLVWRQKVTEAEPSKGGVFGHLKAKDMTELPNLSVPPTHITFVKFVAQVLGKTTDLEIYVSGGRMPFFGTLTAEHADAPPILQWDSPEDRNPVSWYTYSGGTIAGQWGIAGGKFQPVSGIMLQPTMWAGEKYEHQGKGAVFIIHGAVDSREGGNALFPECLIADLREIRATIEAYSKSAKLGGREQASANGIGLSASAKAPTPLHVRATINGQRLEYIIDRWD